MLLPFEIPLYRDPDIEGRGLFGAAPDVLRLDADNVAILPSALMALPVF